MGLRRRADPLSASGLASITRRWATARRTSGRTTPTCRFTRSRKPLSRCRVALITTAAPFKPDAGDQGPGAPYNAKAKFYTVYSGDSAQDHDLRIAHVAIDRQHTTAEDPGTYFPLAELRRRAAEGRIGSVAPRFHGAPTNRSHRVTLEQDCPEIVARCKEDGVDAAILVPNCPVCHQTLSLAARTLEDNGIATIVMGCAKDIVEHVGVPRFLFSDFPLGNAAGRPRDRAIAGVDARARVPGLSRARRRHGRRCSRRSMERESRLEARLLQHRAPYAGGDHATARRIRPRQGGGRKAARSHLYRSGNSFLSATSLGKSLYTM